MTKINIAFQPGCFDNFEGTQEELDELIKEIQRLADSGELVENLELIDNDDYVQPIAKILQ